ncbi:MAG: PilZ domain-containing protein [Hydrogenovibrio sp.]|nr:PilZ domain-containing protein [Hydrogenovibrio sp.]
MTTNTLNRRQVERTPTERPVTLYGSQQNMDGKMIDLSTKGVGVVAYHDCFTENEIEIEFLLPTQGEKALRLAARIIYSAKVRGNCFMGMAFTDLSEANRSKISEFIRQHKRLD